MTSYPNMLFQHNLTVLPEQRYIIRIDQLAVNSIEVNDPASYHFWAGDRLNGRVIISPKPENPVHVEIRLKGKSKQAFFNFLIINPPQAKLSFRPASESIPLGSGRI